MTKYTTLLPERVMYQVRVKQLGEQFPTLRLQGHLAAGQKEVVILVGDKCELRDGVDGFPSEVLMAQLRLLAP